MITTPLLIIEAAMIRGPITVVTTTLEYTTQVATTLGRTTRVATMIQELMTLVAEVVTQGVVVTQVVDVTQVGDATPEVGATREAGVVTINETFCS